MYDRQREDDQPTRVVMMTRRPIVIDTGEGIFDVRVALLVVSVIRRSILKIARADWFLVR
jgi:hypothetical protein